MGKANSGLHCGEEFRGNPVAIIKCTFYRKLGLVEWMAFTKTRNQAILFLGIFCRIIYSDVLTRRFQR